MVLTKKLLVFLFLPLISWADIPPEYPAFKDKVQINASSLMWPDRVFIRWKLSDGSWWCTFDTKERVRAAMVQNVDDMLAHYGSGNGANSWRDINLMLFVGQGTLGVFEKSYCFSNLP